MNTRTNGLAASRLNWRRAVPALTQVALGAMCLGGGAAHAALIDLHSTPDGTVIQIGDALLQHDTNVKHTQKAEFWWVDQDRNSDGLFTGLNSNESNPPAAPNDADFNAGKTYPIKVSDLYKTTDGAYYAFLFDANQRQCDADDTGLKCDHVDFRTLDFYSSSSLYANIGDLNSADLLWSLDGLEDNTLRIDGNKGMGGADMYLYLPVAGLKWVADGYLYIHGVYTNGNDGQETWASADGLTNPNPAPEPGSLALGALGLAGLAVLRRRKA